MAQAENTPAHLEADTWAWTPADPAEVPSDPTPAPVARAALGDYLNLALIGIAGLSLAILMTRPRR